ncbi:MAG TPA: tRNA (adenosine(37)-N6)-dimethylallyltransferase MiaA [Candidatus Binatia bacterium]|jgi:tRNA dimethylallyltransferase|nr:tRNA (adenosine(37)-N6)-dimethylallyltransferase MiaA [Candidatus Binatia bacterium]
MDRPRIVCVVGPTASGKSALGLLLAERSGGEVVSADSRQVYRGLDVGTAKPTAAERARVPHHGLDLVAPTEPFDAARFRAAATAAIDAILARGRVPIVVGGTGLWLRVLLRGLCPAPPRVPRLRAALERMVAAEGAPALHRWLAALDPALAARVHPADAVRIVRGVEVALATGVPLSRTQAAHGFDEAPYDALVVGLAWPTAALEARIAARARAMVDAGFVEEVRALRASGVPPDAPGFDAVGYREMLAAVEGRASVEEALAATVGATRRFAKRQRTWFRREPGVHWRRAEDETPRIVAEVERFLARGTRPVACARAEIANPGGPR